MPGSGLDALYSLFTIDSALHDLKQHASALDMGQEESARIKAVEAESGPVLQTSRELSQESLTLELEQKSLQAKVDKLYADLYGGKIVNPREVETVEKEIDNVKAHLSKNDERLLELYELLPPAKSQAEAVEREIASLKEAIATKQAASRAQHAKLQEAYKAKAAERAPRAGRVPKPLLDQYELIRGRLGGIAMATVTEGHRCSFCGMHVPEKAFEALGLDRVVPCENCRRILFRQVHD